MFERRIDETIRQIRLASEGYDARNWEMVTFICEWITDRAILQNVERPTDLHHAIALMWSNANEVKILELIYALKDFTRLVIYSISDNRIPPGSALDTLKYIWKLGGQYNYKMHGWDIWAHIYDMDNSLLEELVDSRGGRDRFPRMLRQRRWQMRRFRFNTYMRYLYLKYLTP